MSKVAGKFGSSSTFAEQYEKYFIPGWFNELTAVTLDYAGDIRGSMFAHGVKDLNNAAAEIVNRSVLHKFKVVYKYWVSNELRLIGKA